MPQPSLNQVHVDAILTNISVAYMQKAENFIADKVFPAVPVDKKSNLFFKYNKNDWFRDEAQRRAGGTESAGSGYGLTTDSYSCDYANSDPINDIEAAKEKILSTTGLEANTLVLGYGVFRQLRHHPDIIDRFKYTTSQNITADILARLFEVDRVLVAKAVKATNKEGATGAYDFAYGKSALLCHVASNPGLLTPSAGYQFSWTGVSGGLGSTIGTSQFRMEHLKSDRVEAEIAFDNKVVAADLGYFMGSAIA